MKRIIRVKLLTVVLLMMVSFSVRSQTSRDYTNSWNMRICPDLVDNYDHTQAPILEPIYIMVRGKATRFKFLKKYEILNRAMTYIGLVCVKKRVLFANEFEYKVYIMFKDKSHVCLNLTPTRFNEAKKGSLFVFSEYEMKSNFLLNQVKK